MRSICLALTALTLGVASAGAQDIFVRDFGASEINYPSGNTPKIRRGTTSRVKIIKDFIDLVPFQMVSVTGTGVTLGSISNGKTPAGTGFIQMNVTVPAGFNLGSNVTLNVGLNDRFNLRVVNQGLVTSMTANPQPSTIQVGTPWTATVSGVDLNGAVPATLACHTTSNLAQGATSVTFTVTRNATCATNSFVLNVNPSGANDPPKYVTSAGQAPALAFSYIPPPPTGVVCTSVPNIGAPTIRTPSGGQAIVFGSGAPSPSNITIRWDSLTVNQQAAPNNEWLVSYTPGNTSAGGLLPGTNGKSTTSLVRGLSKTLPVIIPGSHTISIQAKNCGSSASVASVSFVTRY